jgi:hypothetical protein
VTTGIWFLLDKLYPPTFAKMHRHFQLAQQKQKLKRSQSAGRLQGKKVKDQSMTAMYLDRCKFIGKQYDKSYSSVKPLGPFWKILTRRCTGDWETDNVADRKNVRMGRSFER